MAVARSKKITNLYVTIFYSKIFLVFSSSGSSKISVRGRSSMMIGTVKAVLRSNAKNTQWLMNIVKFSTRDKGFAYT